MLFLSLVRDLSFPVAHQSFFFPDVNLFVIKVVCMP